MTTKEKVAIVKSVVSAYKDAINRIEYNTLYSLDGDEMDINLAEILIPARLSFGLELLGIQAVEETTIRPNTVGDLKDLLKKSQLHLQEFKPSMRHSISSYDFGEKTEEENGPATN